MSAGSYREQIYDAFADHDRDFDDQIHQALEIGVEYLDLSIGFLTQIREGTQTIIQSTGGHESIQPGQTCPLEQAYCRQTIETDGVLTVKCTPAEPAVSATAYETFGLETYLGVKVMKENGVYGTVCFADEDERDRQFSDAEELFVELLSSLTSQALQRRNYERELQKRNERLASEKQLFEDLADVNFDIIFRLNPDGRFTYVSTNGDTALGYDPEVLTGNHFTDFMNVSSIDNAVTAYSETLEGKTIQQREFEFRNAGGETVLIEVNAAPIFDDDQVVGVQGVCRDVTEQRERERELRLKTRAIDDANVGIVITDATQENQVVYANEGFSRLTGYPRPDIVGENCRLLQGEATDPDSVDTLRQRIDAREPVVVELVNYRKDGSMFWNKVRLSPVESDDGDVTHYLGFQTDITDRKRTEQLFSLLNRILRHNMRNDMNVVLGAIDLIQHSPESDVQELSEVIRRKASELVDLSTQARRLEQDARRDRKVRRLDPQPLIKTVVDDYRGSFPEATIDIDVGTNRGICAGVELETALSELVENGLKHNPSVDSWLGIEVTDANDDVEITIKDDGPGIEEIEASVITNGRETVLEHGSGLGLWLVNWIVTRYGGSFQIRASDRGGSVATIRIPGVTPNMTIEEGERQPTILSCSGDNG